MNESHEEQQVVLALDALGREERASAPHDLPDQVVLATRGVIDSATPAPIAMPVAGRWARVGLGLAAAVVVASAAWLTLGSLRAGSPIEADVVLVSTLDEDIETWELLDGSLGVGGDSEFALLAEAIDGASAGIDLSADEMFEASGAL